MGMQVEELSTITGRFAPLPEWAAQGGAIVGLQGGSEVVRNKVAILEHIGTPIIAVWLQVRMRVRPFHIPCHTSHRMSKFLRLRMYLDAEISHVHE